MGGVSLSQDYTLEQCLGGDDSAAFFKLHLPGWPSRGCEGSARVGRRWRALLELWHRTRQLRHSNLIELIDCGRADHGGETVCYAVFEAPTKPSPQRSAGRRSIHRKRAKSSIPYLKRFATSTLRGWCSARWIREHIVAVGDRIKLSTDSSATPPPRPPTAKTCACSATSGSRLSCPPPEEFGDRCPRGGSKPADPLDSGRNQRRPERTASNRCLPRPHQLSSHQSPCPRSRLLRFPYRRRSSALNQRMWRPPLDAVSNMPPCVASRSGFSWAPPEFCC